MNELNEKGVRRAHLNSRKSNVVWLSEHAEQHEDEDNAEGDTE